MRLKTYLSICVQFWMSLNMTSNLCSSALYRYVFVFFLYVIHWNGCSITLVETLHYVSRYTCTLLFLSCNIKQPAIKKHNHLIIARREWERRRASKRKILKKMPLRWFGTHEIIQPIQIKTSIISMTIASLHGSRSRD